MKTIDLMYFNAGGGHRAAAMALNTVIRQQARPWQVRLVNLMEVLDPQNVFRKATGMYPEDLYNSRLARGWTLGLAQELKLLQAFIRLSHKSLTRQLRRHWRRTKPDMVVSLVPNFNRPMCDALAAVSPDSVYVTILTDFADYPPHFWIEPEQPQHLICGTTKAVAQARGMGCAPARIHATSGMIIRPEFYADSPVDRRAEMLRLKLDPDRPTGIVMFGGHGSSAMQSIARKLADTQLILVCGHNTALTKRLTAMHASAPRLVIGFTADIPYYMALSDFFVGKPGPGSISEAILRGLPVIVVGNAWTMPQERYNVEWIQENGAGIVLDSFRSIRAGVAQVTDRLEEFRANIAGVRNHAVFEIPDVLDRLLQAGRAHHRAAETADAVVPLH